MAKQEYVNSAKLLARAKRVLAGGVSSEFRKNAYPHALYYTHGKGSQIFDVDGNQYLDFTLSQGPLLLGHAHPQVLKAVTDYAANGQLFAGQHIKEIQLAEKIHQLIPCAELIRFCLDGSAAVQTAFRVARAKTGRPKFLRFEGHYHGWLDNVCWGLSTPSVDALGCRESPNIYPWTTGLPPLTKSEFMILPWNDSALLRKTIEKNYKDIAAIITEPVMCNNGCILPKEGFLQEMRQLCTEYGIALIFDEVITGFRLSLGGAQQYFNVTPDIAVFAKALASGYPISAVVGKRDWMREIEESRVIHAGTMNSGNSSVAAALATINILENENPYDRIFYLGDKLMNGLARAAAVTHQNLLIQGPGPMFITAFTPLKQWNDYRDTLTCNKQKTAKFLAAMHDKGIRIIGRGLWYISAAHTEADIDRAINVGSEVLAEL